MRNIESYSKHLKDLIRENGSDEHESKIRILKTTGELITTVNSNSLSGMNLSFRFLTDADLSGKNMEGTILDRAFLERSNLSKTNLTNSILTGAFLSYANLTGAILTGSDFRRARLENAIISDCEHASGANFSEAYMEQLYARNSNMKGCSFFDSKLYDSSMHNCNLEGSDFSGALISFCDFSGSNMRNVIGLEKAKAFWRANFRGCDLTGVPLEFFLKLLKIESDGLLTFSDNSNVKTRFSRSGVTLEDFLMDCKGVPWSKIKARIKTKNLFGI